MFRYLNSVAQCIILTRSRQDKPSLQYYFITSSPRSNLVPSHITTLLLYIITRKQSSSQPHYNITSLHHHKEAIQFLATLQYYFFISSPRSNLAPSRWRRGRTGDLSLCRTMRNQVIESLINLRKNRMLNNCYYFQMNK